MSFGLFILGILPAALLMRYIYKKDRIDKEPKGLLTLLFFLGAASTIFAALIENIGEDIIDDYLYTDSMVFLAIDAFLIVALAEELGKYFVVKKFAWNNAAFNTTFDAVVYAVFASLGFATLENILYLLDGSVYTAIVRGILSVPGHAIDAVFMGNYLGIAKRCEALGDNKGKKENLRKALLMPVLTHGFYDFCLFAQTPISLLSFLVYEIIITVYTIKKVNKLSKEDTLLFPGGFYPGHYAASQLYMQGAIPGYQPAGFQTGSYPQGSYQQGSFQPGGYQATTFQSTGYQTPYFQSSTNNFDPMTGRPIMQQRPFQRFDTNTGRPIYQQPAQRFDPNTGMPIYQQSLANKFDPNTGKPIYQPPTLRYDPNTGKPVYEQRPAQKFDPETGEPIYMQSPANRFDPNTGQRLF